MRARARVCVGCVLFVPFFFFFSFCIFVFNCLYFNFVVVVVVRLRFVRFGVHPQWDTTDAEIDSLTSDRPGLSKVLPLKLEVGQNKTLRASHTARNSSVILSKPSPSFLTGLVWAQPVSRVARGRKQITQSVVIPVDAASLVDLARSRIGSNTCDTGL